MKAANKAVSVAILAAVGVFIADLIAHPTGPQAAGKRDRKVRDDES